MRWAATASCHERSSSGAKQVQSTQRVGPEIRRTRRGLGPRAHARKLRTFTTTGPVRPVRDLPRPGARADRVASRRQRGWLLAGQALESLRQKRRILTGAEAVIDRALLGKAIARVPIAGSTAPWSEPLHGLSHRAKLDELLKAQGRQQHHLVDHGCGRPLKTDSATCCGNTSSG